MIPSATRSPLRAASARAWKTMFRMSYVPGLDRLQIGFRYLRLSE
jgi:hypothetical protein